MKQKSILIVDDDADIVQLIEVHLKQDGFKVLRAYNGVEALDILETNDIQLAICLVKIKIKRGYRIYSYDTLFLIDQ
nr:response regulator [Bacillus sp. XF8]